MKNIFENVCTFKSFVYLYDSNINIMKITEAAQTAKQANQAKEGDMVFCSRCKGTGQLNQYGHVEGGACFKCNGVGAWKKTAPKSETKEVCYICRKGDDRMNHYRNSRDKGGNVPTNLWIGDVLEGNLVIVAKRAITRNAKGEIILEQKSKNFDESHKIINK